MSRLDPLLRPASLAVVGASERAGRGRAVLENAIALGYSGEIYPINPKYTKLLGRPCFPSLEALPHAPDLVISALPASGTRELMTSVAAAGSKALVVLASGFGEGTGNSRAGELELQSIVDRGVLVCGPNCVGFINVEDHVAAISSRLPMNLRSGAVAIVSQSGGVGLQTMFRLIENKAVGVSHFVNCGNTAGLGVEAFIEDLIERPNVTVVGAYVEQFRDVDALRRIGVRLHESGKSLVVLKVGRSEQSRRASLSHTGSLAGDAHVISGLMRQLGICEVHSVEQFIESINVLGQWGTRTLTGRRIFLASASGGECCIAADLAGDAGLDLFALSAPETAALRAALPPYGDPANPLDMTGTAHERPELFSDILSAVAGNITSDCVAVNLNPRPRGKASVGPQGRDFAQRLVDKRAEFPQAVVAYSAVCGADTDVEVAAILTRGGIPFVEGTDILMGVLDAVLPRNESESTATTLRLPPELPAGARALGLEWTASAALMKASGLPTPRSAVVTSASDAATFADTAGYPIVAKIDSRFVAHKSDIGGVMLNLASAAAVKHAFGSIMRAYGEHVPSAAAHGVLVQAQAGPGFDLIVGAKRDPVFGWALVVGLGGIYAEALRDVSVRVAPLSRADISSMLHETAAWDLLTSPRREHAADVAALIAAIAAVAEMTRRVDERINSVEVNPLRVLDDGSGVVALDVWCGFDV